VGPFIFGNFLILDYAPVFRLSSLMITEKSDEYLSFLYWSLEYEIERSVVPFVFLLWKGHKKSDEHVVWLFGQILGSGIFIPKRQGLKK
jgi:hypothetical protein